MVATTLNQSVFRRRSLTMMIVGRWTWGRSAYRWTKSAATMALAIRAKSLSASVMRSSKQQPGHAPVKTACRTCSSVARFSGLAQTVASRRAPCRHLRLMTTAVRPADGVCDTLLDACSRDQAQGGVQWSTPAQHHRAQDLTPITRSRISRVAPVIHRHRIKNPRSAAMHSEPSHDAED